MSAPDPYLLVPIPKRVLVKVTPKELRIHNSHICEGQTCVFHNPTKHHMDQWQIHVRLDRYGALAERICPHGIGHPDPDSLAYVMTLKGATNAEGVHGCDGCCRP